MIVGAMDIATTTGVAHWDGDKFHTQTFKANVKKNILDNEKALNADREGEIVRKFQDFTQIWLIENRIETVFIEQPIPSNPVRKKRQVNTDSNWAGQAITYTEVAGTSQAAIFRIYGLEAAAAAICSRLNIPVKFVSQGTWRKSFLGSGRPSNAKQEAVKECKRLGIEISSVDAAEACGLCWHAVQEMYPQKFRKAEDLFAGRTSIPAAEFRAQAEALFKK